MQQGRLNNNDANRINPTGQATEKFTVRMEQMIDAGVKSNVSYADFSVVIHTGGAFYDIVVFRIFKNTYNSSKQPMFGLRSVASWKEVKWTKQIMTTP